MKDELRYEYFSVCKTLLTNQEVTKWQIFSSKHLQQVEPVLFTEVGCGGCNVASYVFKPSASTPPSHSPPDLFNEKAEKLVLQEIVFQFEFYKKKLCSQYFVQNKTRFTFSPIELKSKFLSLSAFIHWLPKEGVDRTSGLKKILSLQRFWRIVSSLIKWSSHKHDWFSCKSVATSHILYPILLQETRDVNILLASIMVALTSPPHIASQFHYWHIDTPLKIYIMFIGIISIIILLVVHHPLSRSSSSLSVVNL